MRAPAVLISCLAWASAASAQTPEAKATPAPGSRKAEPMVDLKEVAPRIVIELRYATPRNITRRPIYPAGARCFVRKSVAERLIRAQQWLDAHAPRDTRLKIWDGWRPAEAHRILWKTFPNREYLGDPRRGGSLHTWGVCVDATLVDAADRELRMPTDFDVFTPAAKTYYTGNETEVIRNLRWLQTAMTKGGFHVVMDEWWHFVARDWQAFGPVKMSITEGPMVKE
jgi:D-alanyl-D-alanine dipeptidase